ncbi:GIY-YIG nuclease family protein [Ectopseudomonas oleovorans]|jgi:hypothetical protein|uniref:GIY-YIG nuclease family protein n=1 Tax=Ectopseudomonas oleovorans TaxID=301 RepID=A0AA42TW38_ECTOL|nr:GIY-YIG nuclease family protein [Pseudomonas oleovorans]MDH1341897.1 GIY-YIG nuclease family protein [Pseudomonas oleovorans]MDH1490893.1 GIY-YIG nuclease family protein [Pseudomonas oleovorans]WGG19604.1 GIY-YIG nuclease family protein [Pseudomonas oleovorans]
MTTKEKGAKPAPKQTSRSGNAPAMVAIYALCDPGTGEIRYVGKASDPAARLKSHLRDARRRATPVYRWINKLGRSSQQPTMRVLVWTDDWRTDERRQITILRAEGCRLLNVAEGGDEPACSPAVRAANGRKVASMRDPLIWRYRRMMGSMLAWLRKNSTTNRADHFASALRLFDSLGKDKQRLIATRAMLKTGEALA